MTPKTPENRPFRSVPALAAVTLLALASCGEVAVESPLNSAKDALAFIAGLDAAEDIQGTDTSSAGDDTSAVAQDGATTASDTGATTGDSTVSPDTTGPTDTSGTADGGTTTTDTIATPDGGSAPDAAGSSCPGKPGCPCTSIADCDDKNPCTGPDSCIAGKCAPAKLISCADKDECTLDTCDPKLGCQNTYKEGLECDDGDVCTAPDACNNGKCDGKTKSCDDNDSCTDDTCLKSSGCQHYAKNDGTACDDGSACTKDDKCDKAVCKGVGKLCKDSDPCTEDGCDDKGNCTHDKVQDGTPCSDGDKCTTGDICKSNQCVGEKEDCNDKNACTNDSCDKASGCKHAALKENDPCDDGDACTLDTKCVASVCTGKPKVCDDDSICTADGCDPKDGCNTTPVADGAPCDTGKKCQAGVCVAPGGCPNGAYKDNYTIKPDGTGDFKSIDEALQKLGQCGVAGPTDINVLAGTYTGAKGFVFPKVPGATAKWPIRIHAPKNKAGGWQTVKLRGNTGAGNGSATILVAKDAAHWTIEGFVIDGGDSANKVQGNFAGPVVLHEGGGQSNIRLRGLQLLNFKGAAFKDTSYIAGIFIHPKSGPVSDITIENCEISGFSPSGATSTQGLVYVLGGSVTKLHILANRFVNNSSVNTIQLHNVAKLTDLLIANNEAVLNGKGFLELYTKGTAGNTPRVVFNSLLFIAPGYAVKGGLVGPALLLRNNIFSSTFKTPPTMVVGTPVVASNNALHNVVAGYSNGANDLPLDPKFVKTIAPYDLHIANDSPMKGQALAIAAVPTDKDGDKRELPPDIGMDESPGSTQLKPCIGTYKAPMKGLYTVGKGGEFTTVNAALTALQGCNLGGPTIFELVGGTYTESQGFDIPYVSGMGAKAPLTIRAKSGNLKGSYQEVRLAGLVSSGIPRAVMRIPNNGRYITLEGLVFDGSVGGAALTSSYHGAVAFQSNGGQQHVNLRNLRFINYSTSTWKGGYSGMIFGYLSQATSYITIEGCTFENNAAASVTHNSVGLISFRNGSHSNLTIARNRFANNDADAINFRDVKHTDNLVANNMFVLGNGRVAVDLYGGNAAVSTLRFVHNSLLFVHGSSAAVRGTLSGKGLEVRNNAARATVGKPTFIQNTYTVSSGHNCLANLVTGYKVTTGDVLATTIGFVKTAAPYDLHIQSSSKCLNQAVFMADITDDFDGQPRGKTRDIGADEI